MIEAEELRIGNFVLNNKNEIIEIESIGWQHGINLCVDSGRDYCILDADYSFSEITPIPLTEEWLLRLGFEKKASYFLHEKHSVRIETGNMYEWNYNRYEYGKIKIEYTHQLQNLYFALTGEELEVKDKIVG